MPHTEFTEEESDNSEDIPVGEVITIHDEIIFEVGKEMFKSSLKNLNEYCRFMITISFGAIPIFLGLLNFVTPKSSNKLWLQLLSFLTLLLFLASAIVFIFGYFPMKRRFSLDRLEEIANAYSDLLIKKKRLVVSGSIVFFASIVISIAIITMYIFW